MFSLRLWFAAGAVLLAGRSSAQETGLAPATAETALAEFRAVTSAQDRLQREARWRTTAGADRERITAAAAELTCALGERFLADYPADPRRWEAIGAMFIAQRAFTGADADARRSAWEKRCDEWRAAVMAADDVPAAIAERVLYFDTLRAVRSRSGTTDLPHAAANLDFLATRLPAAKNRGPLERIYLDALQRSDPAAVSRRLKQLVADSNPAVAETAQLKLAALALQDGPVQLKFPDLDGREIDLAQYRGKVVLIDFWATWCVPCMAEMPNVKAVYQKYRSLGFEVIGVTDDTLAADPNNVPRGRFTVATLKAFLAKEGMTWPQLWDTRPQDPPTVKRLLRQFDVSSLPTTLLIDRDGRLSTRDNHGEKLEANVRKLLGLPPAP